MTAAGKKKEVTIGGAVGVPPAGAVALRSLTMRNVLSFGAEATVELGALNVLIGANGCGKSNLMDVIALLKAAATTDLSDEFRGGGAEWPWKGGGEKLPEMQVESEWQGGDDVVYCHRIAIRVRESGAYSIANESIGTPEYPDVLRAHGRDVRVSILGGGELNHGADFGAAYVSLRDFSDMREQVCIYRGRHVGRTGRGQNPLRVAGPADKLNNKVSESLDNFPNVLNRVYADPESKKSIDEKMREFYEDARSIYFNVAHGAVEAVLQESSGRATPVSRMSDGMLNWLFLLTVLLDPKPPALVCIDEPETGLHPDMFSALTKLLVDASKRMQLIVTTHSGGIVDALADTPEAILVCDKTAEGATTLHRLSAEEVRDWEEEGLGMAWASGAIGGTRW